MGKMIPTTDEMDKTTPTERYALVAQCTSCGEWLHFIGSQDKASQTSGLQCTCGGKQFTGLISERTFNPTLAKRKRTRRQY